MTDAVPKLQNEKEEEERETQIQDAIHVLNTAETLYWQEEERETLIQDAIHVLNAAETLYWHNRATVMNHFLARSLLIWVIATIALNTAPGGYSTLVCGFGPVLLVLASFALDMTLQRYYHTKPLPKASNALRAHALLYFPVRQATIDHARAGVWRECVRVYPDNDVALALARLYLPELEKLPEFNVLDDVTRAERIALKVLLHHLDYDGEE